MTGTRGTVHSDEPKPAAPKPWCGPKALKIVCDQLGVKAEVEELVKLARTDNTGTSLEGLRKAATAKGLSARALAANVPYLEKMPKPTIAWIGGNHFAVVTKVARGCDEYTDPDAGQKSASASDFAKTWGGAVLEIQKPSPDYS